MDHVTFDEWKRSIDAKCADMLGGLTTADLADQPWRAWFDNGMTTTDALHTALREEGLDMSDQHVDHGTSTPPEDRSLTLYTVTGLVDINSGELLIAGVYEGDLTSVDTTDATRGFHRWAATIEAESPDQAEGIAIRRYGTHEQSVETVLSGDRLIDDDGSIAEVNHVEHTNAGVRLWFTHGGDQPATYRTSTRVDVVVC